MCGIAGEVRFRVGQGEPADWNKISEMMSRRGPDDSGIWSDNAHCTFVFRRLSIIDLSPRGHQPMTAHNDRYALVFNGEVYNFMDLRKQLENKGIHFCSNSDSEVVLHSLIKWGNEALEKFNGMFALGFYDSYEKKLLLARDHAGIKPLYYLNCPDGIAFSSQYDQLLTHPWSQTLEVSQEALGLYLRLAYIPAPYALLKNSYILEPGTWMEMHINGSIRKGTYFSFPSSCAPSLRGKEALDAVDEAIRAAVKRQLVSDVPVGAFLSGGIDSPLVVSKMREVSSNAIHTFTIATGEEATDESQDATMYAREIGVEQLIYQISPERALGLIDDVINACGEPFGDYSMFPTLAVSRLARSKCKVVLSGDGGDELFWGYPARFGTLIRMSGVFRMPYWLRRFRWEMKNTISSGGRRRYPPMRSLGHYHRSFLTHLEESLLNEIFPTLPSWPSEYAAFDYADWKPDRIAQWSRWNEFVYHLTMVLMKVDRASMYHSLEVRVPLLDREVIDVAAKIDWRDCLDVDQMVGKLPLRRTLARCVKYQTRAKRGFEVPMGTWLKTSLKDLFEEKVVQLSDMLGLEMNRKAMSEVFNRHINGDHDYAWGLWPLLSLSLWAENHYKRHAVH